jgi:SAM-dependent methyltransferase
VNGDYGEFIDVTDDGNPVAVYLALPAGDEPQLIHDAVSPGASILELGCGAGRVTRPLAAMGHPMVAVDNSPAMLKHVTVAQTVCADITHLDLGRTFDAVLVASHLVNHGDRAGRVHCSPPVDGMSATTVSCWPSDGTPPG